MEETRNVKKQNPVIIILLLVIAALLAAILVLFMKQGNDADVAQSSDGTELKYATQGVAMIGDQKTMQQMVDEAVQKAAEGNIALEYKNLAVSKDGKVFDCHIGNSNRNSYDMYIDIYSDVYFEDQLFLSGLIRPGEAFNKIELNRTLEPGTHTVYCAFNQVEEDMKTLHGQVVVSMSFTVG